MRPNTTIEISRKGSNFGQLILNSEEIGKDEAVVTSFTNKPFRIQIWSKRVTDLILQSNLSAFPPNTGTITFEASNTPKSEEEIQIGAISFGEPEQDRYVDKVIFTFYFSINIHNWNRPYSFNDYILVLGSVGLIDYPGFYVDYGGESTTPIDDGNREVYMRFPCHYSNDDDVVGVIVERLMVLSYTIFYKTELSFHSNNKHSVEIVLDLPSDIRVSCEQYLLYFVQFLSDLGVEAKSELRHEAEQVLFSVTPVNKEEALDRIRTALEVYLQLPSGKLSHAGEQAVEVQRLSANILHFQSQLMLRDAIIQAKEATIQLQQTTIQRQQHYLVENVITRSVVGITPQEVEDKEEFWDGALALTKYEDKGVSINLAEIYRKLKRWFQK
jgi:hypothetical protein